MAFGGLCFPLFVCKEEKMPRKSLGSIFIAGKVPVRKGSSYNKKASAVVSQASIEQALGKRPNQPMKARKKKGKGKEDGLPRDGTQIWSASYFPSQEWHFRAPTPNSRLVKARGGIESKNKVRATKGSQQIGQGRRSPNAFSLDRPVKCPRQAKITVLRGLITSSVSPPLSLSRPEEILECRFFAPGKYLSSAVACEKRKSDWACERIDLAAGKNTQQLTLQERLIQGLWPIPAPRQFRAFYDQSPTAFGE
ncbi:hypothetical protein ACFE04_019721 [Oxalis oulophora]